MRKKLKLFLITAIGLILFYKIVINADSIKHNLSWIFEGSEEELALPELSNEEIEKAKNQMRNDEPKRAKKVVAQPEQKEVGEVGAPDAIEQNQDLQDAAQAPVDENYQENVAPAPEAINEENKQEVSAKKQNRKIIKKITQEPAMEEPSLQ
jgi:hypothetical protein